MYTQVQVCLLGEREPAYLVVQLAHVRYIYTCVRMDQPGNACRNAHVRTMGKRKSRLIAS